MCIIIMVIHLEIIPTNLNVLVYLVYKYMIGLHLKGETKVADSMRDAHAILD
jgi:hypothetical protein